MKTHAKYLGIAVLILACFSVADTTYAATIYSQSSFNQSTNALTGGQLTGQSLGTGLTGVVTSFSFWSIKNGVPGAGVLNYGIYSGTNQDCTAGTTVVQSNMTYDPTGQNTGQVYENNSVLTTPHSLDPSKYYCIVATASYANILLAGTTNNEYGGGSCGRIVDGSGTGNCGSAVDLKFALYGTQTASESSYTLNLKPHTASTTATTYVNFTFDYVASASHNITEYRISIHDLTQNNDIVIDGAASSGSHSVSRYVALTSGHTYTWRAWLADASGSLYTGSENPRFSVVTSQFSIGSSFTDITGSSTYANLPLPNITSINEGNASSSVDQLTQSFLNIPAMMANQFPFSWFYDIGTMIKNSASGSTTVPTMTIDFSNASTTGDYQILDQLGQVNIVSEDIVETFLTYDQWQIVRLVIASFMWVAFAYWFIGRISSLTI